MGIDLNNGYEELQKHFGHALVIARYGPRDDPANFAIECETCQEVLLDFDKRYPEEEPQERWAIYDHDANELATPTTYPSYEAAREDADQLNNVIVISLGNVGPMPAEEPEEEEDDG